MTNTDTLKATVGSSEAIRSRVDVGFSKPKEDTVRELFDKTLDAAKLRLEALKLAYDFAFKLGTFDHPDPFNRKTLESQLDAYKQVFELADINHQFIMTGNVTIPLISSLDEEDLI